jgi:signal transduction histidine kinase
MNLNPQPLDLCDVTRQVSESFTDVAARKQIRLNHVTSVETATVSADSRAIMQVLDNLVSNAIKYSSSLSEVDVRLGRSQDHLIVEVVDRGPGISEADQAKLFQRFTRLTARPTAGESSNGLGLSIVKRLVEAMQGNISCRSQIGRGTTFIFKMPSLPGPASTTKPARVPSHSHIEVLSRPAVARFQA